MAHNQLVRVTPRASRHGEAGYTLASGASATPSLYVNGNGYPPDAMVPRSFQSTEGLLSYANSWRAGLDWNIIEISHALNDTVDSVEFQEVAQVCVAVSAPSGPNVATGDSWEARRPEIEKLYIKESRPLWEVAEIMATRGFNEPSVIILLAPYMKYADRLYASREHSYKKRFKKWEWKKYSKVKNYAPPGNRPIVSQSHTGGHDRGRESSSVSTPHEEDHIQSNPRRGPGTCVRPTGSIVEMPIRIRTVGCDYQLKSILSHVEDLYLSHIRQERWQVKDQFLVQVDQHDELLVFVGTGLKNFASQENDVGRALLSKAFLALEKAVVDCGPFSLPMIWESARRMILNGHNTLASMFLAHARDFALRKARLGRHHPFVLVLARLCDVVQKYPERLSYVILKAYHSCIQHVLGEVTSNNLTALTLWSDFVVYMDNRSAREIKQAVDHFQFMIGLSGRDNGVDGDLTLEARGMSLYVLQSTKDTAADAEEVALDMLCKVNRRLRRGEALEGNLLITWKDLKHTLGNFCHDKGDKKRAVALMEESLIYGIDDDRDILTLKSLEEWYTELGELDEAERVRRERLEFSQRE